MSRIPNQQYVEKVPIVRPEPLLYRTLKQTIRDADGHGCKALGLSKWMIGCAAHVLYIFEEQCPDDVRPRRAIKAATSSITDTVARYRFLEEWRWRGALWQCTVCAAQQAQSEKAYAAAWAARAAAWTLADVTTSWCVANAAVQAAETFRTGLGEHEEQRQLRKLQATIRQFSIAAHW